MILLGWPFIPWWKLLYRCGNDRMSRLIEDRKLAPHNVEYFVVGGRIGRTAISQVVTLQNQPSAHAGLAVDTALGLYLGFNVVVRHDFGRYGENLTGFDKLY